MPVQNRIVKVQKRNRALVRYDEARIGKAILRAANSIGGFQQDFLPGVNDKWFAACGSDEQLATFLSDAVTVCLNGDPHHLIANFPPTIETIGTKCCTSCAATASRTPPMPGVLSLGRHWMRERALTPETFMGNGFPQERMKQNLAWARNTTSHRGRCERSRALRQDQEGRQGIPWRSTRNRSTRRLPGHGAHPQRRQTTHVWVSGPSSSGKTTTTVKLTQRLEKHGLRFLMLNLDDYFWSLVGHPTDWINDRNYETPGHSTSSC